MKGRLIFLAVGMLFLTRCGGVDTGPAGDAFAEEAGSADDLVPTIKEAAISAGSDTVNPIVAVDAGFAGNGTTIGIPTGFTASQCKFTAAAANVSGSAISTSVSINTTTGTVRCEKVVQEREEVPPETKDCVASYTVICVRNAE